MAHVMRNELFEYLSSLCVSYVQMQIIVVSCKKGVVSCEMMDYFCKADKL
jgi:hypothetical protein